MPALGTDFGAAGDPSAVLAPDEGFEADAAEVFRSPDAAPEPGAPPATADARTGGDAAVVAAALARGAGCCAAGDLLLPMGEPFDADAAAFAVASFAGAPGRGEPASDTADLAGGALAESPDAAPAAPRAGEAFWVSRLAGGAAMRVLATGVLLRGFAAVGELVLTPVAAATLPEVGILAFVQKQLHDFELDMLAFKGR